MNIKTGLNISKYGIIGIVMFSILFACNQELTFPDPGFDIKSDNEIEIRRDTADAYEIKLAMDVPNGVEKIEVLDGRDYTLIKNITEYKNKTKFNFAYTIDISEIVIDTTLTYIIKVVDRDNRSFNRGFIINVKKFSTPEVFLTGGNNIAVVAPSYILKGEVTTGMYPIDSILISFEDVLQTEIVPDSLITEYTLNEVIRLGNLEPDREYQLVITVIDSRGERSDTFIKVIKGVFMQPKRIEYIDNELGITATFDLFYEGARLDSFVYNYASGRTINFYKLEYNEAGNVTELRYKFYVKSSSQGNYWFHYKKLFYYDDINRLESIGAHYITYFDSGLIEDNGEEVEAQDFTYRDDGTVFSFVGNHLVSDIQYADGFGFGEKIFAEYWGTYKYFDINDGLRRYRTSFDPVFMPSYIYGLPPFIATNASHYKLFNDIFYHQYVYTKTELYVPYGSVRSLRYSYSSDEQGKLVKLSKIASSNGEDVYYDYYFEY